MYRDVKTNVQKGEFHVFLISASGLERVQKMATEPEGWVLLSYPRQRCFITQQRSVQ